ncbi:MAG: carbohydrate kinase [Caldilineaceae bacterium]|nr:carbohydrate kinase [Caldilineaceae bacterium]
MSGSDPLLVGLDVGTTNIKAIVFDLHGRVAAEASARTPTHHPRPGWAFYRPDELWDQTLATLRQAVARTPDPRRIVSVAVASIGETGFPLDEAGNALYDGLAWFDNRTEPQAGQIEATVGADAAFGITGLPVSSIFGLCKMLWLKQNEPDVYARARTWLNTADYIAYRLCRVPATDRSLASRTLALNLDRLAWDEDLIRAVEVDPALFAPLTPSGTPLGPLDADVAAAAGLPASVTVAVGGHDHIVGAMALGINQPGTLLDSMGTAEALFMPLSRPVTDPAAGRQGYEMGAHVSGGYYAIPSYRTAGACIEWFRDTCASQIDFATLDAEAITVGPGAAGVRFLPHLRLPHSPHNDPKSRGAFIGLSTDVTRGALYRAVLEGLVFEMRATLDPLFAYDGVPPIQQIYAIGGVTRNRLLMQIKATLMEQSIYVAELADATALGAALLGGVGAGVYRDIADAAAHVDAPVTSVEPIAAWSELYAGIYRDVYQPLCAALQPINHANYPYKYRE